MRLGQGTGIGQDTVVDQVTVAGPMMVAGRETAVGQGMVIDPPMRIGLGMSTDLGTVAGLGMVAGLEMAAGIHRAAPVLGGRLLSVLELFTPLNHRIRHARIQDALALWQANATPRAPNLSTLHQCRMPVFEAPSTYLPPQTRLTISVVQMRIVPAPRTVSEAARVFQAQAVTM